jgi:monoamine oxidase
MPYYHPFDASGLMLSISALQSDLAGIQTSVTNLDNSITTINTSISNAQTAITNLQAAVTALQASQKRIEVYNGTTNASGDYTVVFTTPFASTPHINPCTLPPANSTTRVRVTAVSTTGFTVKTETNGGLSVLGLSVLGLATTNVASVPVGVLIREV